MLTLTNSDIIQTLESLASEILKAEGGSTTTVKSEDLFECGDVIGNTIVFLNGNLLGQEATIQSANNDIFTLDTELTNAVTNKTKFAHLEVGFSNFISRAEAIIADKLRNKGLKLELFLTSAQLKELHTYKTIELICLSKRRDANDDDIYHANYLTFQELFNVEFGSLVADYDADEDGNIDTDEENTNVGQVSFLR